MNKNIPVITVTCFRDLALLDLQAQGVSQYLDTSCPVFLVVNEPDPTAWEQYFNQHLRHYYSKHQLTIIYRKDFEGEWEQWIDSPINPWAVGWETQQILKLVVSKYVDGVGYLVLDSQNFLIKPWSLAQYNYESNQVPYRSGHFTMPTDIWEQYSQSLSIRVDKPTSNTISMCTPFFMHTQLVQGLISTRGGVLGFSRWFKQASKTKSEFILYALWAEKHGGIDKFHYRTEDWANPYLRDSRTTFAENVEYFIGFIGEHAPHAWASINHRSWGDMSSEQYQAMCDKLETFNLFPNFTEYRKSYVDIKI